jgi:toxin ParE1/3/4
MPVALLWYPQAKADLLDIYGVTGLENPSAAERAFDLLEARTQRLAAHPLLGPRRPDIRASMRVLVEGPYLILYETLPDAEDGPVQQVAIVRVIDGRRDFARMF